MSTGTAQRPLVALLAGGTLVLVALMAAPLSEAAVIHVCVKKGQRGPMRLVSRSTRCGRDDRIVLLQPRKGRDV